MKTIDTLINEFKAQDTHTSGDGNGKNLVDNCIDILVDELVDCETDEDKKGWINDLLQHGCSSGMIGALIYYNDTIAFYEENKDDINALLYEQMEETGIYSLSEMFGKNFDEEDPLCINQINKNLLVWFAFEDTISHLNDFIEENEEN